MEIERLSGVLMPIFSLPGRDAIGDIGTYARQFIDMLKKTGQSFWQILPMHPTSFGDSPFQGPSVFAGNPNLIDLESLVIGGDLSQKHLSDYYAIFRKSKETKQRHKHDGSSILGLPNPVEEPLSDLVDYGFIWEHKLGFEQGKETAILRKAYENFKKDSPNSKRMSKFNEFCENNKPWLEDYSLFMALKEKNGFSKIWNQWNEREKFRTRDYAKDASDKTEFYKYIQFIFDKQMSLLKDYANSQGIRIIGDMPIYPAYDSADVWANPSMFFLDDKLNMKGLSGVPPDYFSKEGQLWGNPVYKWSSLKEMDSEKQIIDWWVSRLKHELKYVDIVKVDHFRGFDTFGVCPPGEKDAINCKWVDGPGKWFFDCISDNIDYKNVLIAEDLGGLTKRVRDLIKYTNIPGMRVLQFADHEKKEDEHQDFPTNKSADPNSVFYVGTHDNETFMQFLQETKTKDVKTYQKIVDYLARVSKQSYPNWQAIDAIQRSNSKISIITMQDLLELGKEARINLPSSESGNWRWRIENEDFYELQGYLGDKLHNLTEQNGRVKKERIDEKPADFSS